MTALHGSSILHHFPAVVWHRARVLPRVGTAIPALLRLWRERHRQRRELMLLCDLGLRDTGLSWDLVAHEMRKWPWQPWHSQLHHLEAVARMRAGLTRK